MKRPSGLTATAHTPSVWPSRERSQRGGSGRGSRRERSRGKTLFCPCRRAAAASHRRLQGAVRGVQPAQVVIKGQEEPFGSPSDGIFLQTQAFLKGGQHPLPFGVLRRPGRQGQAVVGLQVKDRGRPAAGLQEVKIGQQGVEGIPGAGLEVMMGQVVPQVGSLGRQAAPGQPFQRFAGSAQETPGAGEQEATVQVGQFESPAQARR
jgi:hypothetical protein